MVKDLTVGRPESVLVKFCLPLLGSVVFQQLYNIADSLIAGRYAGEDALAAVGNSYEITLIYLAFAFGCNMGCSVIVSQLFGAKKYKDMKTAVNTTFISSGILCLILMVIGITCGSLLLDFINTPANIKSDSQCYLEIYTWGLVFLFFYNIATGIFSALGDSKTPFIFLAFSSVTNVFVDILFVKYFDMGVAGVAWATFICQGVSCILSMVVVMKKLAGIHSEEDDGEKTVLFSMLLFKKIVRIAIPSTLQQSFVSVGNIILQGRINNYGSSVIAGYSAAIKLNNLVITTLTALGNGISNFSAQNLGAGKYKRIKDGRNAGIKLVLAMSVIITGIYLLFGSFFVNLFMDSESNKALEIGVQFLNTVAPFYLVVGIKLATDGVLRGVGAMKQFMIGTFADLILRVGFAFIFSAEWGSAGIWAAWPVGWSIGTILSIIMFSRLMKNINNQKIA
ncbi:MAG: MATE family efflux transporter [Wujia sp.]